ncbi:hypothetical protein V2154_16485 [Ewingella sp. CoE-038-23]|uniref:hypothetical protein n=1 Tax=Ewingella docleensis TaxID=3118588 RepID=UPI003365A89C
MGSKVDHYIVVYRGQYEPYIAPGQYVFFQREKRYGGGFWFGVVMDGFYQFALEHPVSLGQGIEYWFSIRRAMEGGDVFDDSLDDFKLVSG